MSDNPSFNRRDFLKISGLTVASAALGASKFNGVVNKLVLADTIVNSESGISQELRRQKLEEATEKGVLEEWLKFSALELYAKSTGMVLGMNTVRQFMYGEGQTLDIKPLIPKSVKENPVYMWDTSMEDLALMTDNQVLDAFARNSMQWALYSNLDFKTRHFNIESGLFRQQISVSGAGFGVNEDFEKSLNMFTFSFNGGILKATENIDEEVVVVDVLGGDYKMTDIYDWDQLKLGASLNVNGVFDFMLQVLDNAGIDEPKSWLLDKRDKIRMGEHGDFLSKQIISVTNHDGYKLQKSGVAKIFKIESEWETSEFQIRVPFRVLNNKAK